MGRYVYEGGDCVWKYVFGEQPSEQFRIAQEIKIGEMEDSTYEDENGNEVVDFNSDTLHLTQKDRRKLEKWLSVPITIKTNKGTIENTDLFNFGKKIGEQGKEYKPIGKITRMKIILVYEQICKKSLFYKKNGILCGSLEEFILSSLRDTLQDVHFYRMVRAYIKHMRKNREQYDFYFNGEY